jgi:hypothetical protein
MRLRLRSTVELVEYSRQRFLLEKALTPFLDLSRCRGGWLVGHPLRQLFETMFKLPAQQVRFAFVAPSCQALFQTPFQAFVEPFFPALLEFAAENFVIEQTVKNRRLPDLLFNSSLDAPQSYKMTPTGAVIVDPDGVYDPGLLNDRLLLRLKSP